MYTYFVIANPSDILSGGDPPGPRSVFNVPIIIPASRLEDAKTHACKLAEKYPAWTVIYTQLEGVCRASSTPRISSLVFKNGDLLPE